LRTLKRPANKAVINRTYSAKATINLHERLGVGEDGIPEVVVIPGITGEYAYNFFRESFKRGGQKIAQAFEAELNILTWSVRSDPDWDVLTTSPFFSLEDKNKTVKSKCQTLGLTPFFHKQNLETC
jgi:hypothetical protein